MDKRHCFWIFAFLLPIFTLFLYARLLRSTMGAMANNTRTIAIVGGSYVGMRLAQALLPSLPATHRVVVVEANSHFHHLFTFPRFSVLHRGGEEKALIPYTHALDGYGSPGQGQIVHAKALSIHPAGEGGWLKLDRPVNDLGGDRVEFDYLAIATGTLLREPWSLPSTRMEAKGAKGEAVQKLRWYQDAVKEACNIVIVGGGAVGVQVACDIAELYPPSSSGKKITVLHSRTQLMNKFHVDLHELVANRFAERGIQTHLGSRVVIPPSGVFSEFEAGKTFEVKLQDGTVVEADLVLMCTGQTPRSDLLAEFDPSAVTSDGFINVLPTLQLLSPSSTPLHSRIFALGDIANTGAGKTVRAATTQIQTVKDNILALINGVGVLEEFKNGPSGIHLSLGLYESVKFGNPEKEGDKPRNMGVERDLKRDMGIEGVWGRWGVPKGTPWHL